MCGCAPIVGYELPPAMMAPNVEPFGMQIIGSLPVQGDEMLASMSVDLEPSAEVTIPTRSAQPTLPSLGAPKQD